MTVMTWRLGITRPPATPSGFCRSSLQIKEPVKILSSLPVDTHEARSAASCVLSPILRKHRVLPIVILQGLEISVDVLG